MLQAEGVRQTDTDHVLLVGLNQLLHRHRQAQLHATLVPVPAGSQHAASEQHTVVVLQHTQNTADIHPQNNTLW